MLELGILQLRGDHHRSVKMYKIMVHKSDKHRVEIIVKYGTPEKTANQSNRADLSTQAISVAEDQSGIGVWLPFVNLEGKIK